MFPGKHWRQHDIISTCPAFKACYYHGRPLVVWPGDGGKAVWFGQTVVGRRSNPEVSDENVVVEWKALAGL